MIWQRGEASDCREPSGECFGGVGAARLVFCDHMTEDTGTKGTDGDQQCELIDLGSVFGTVRDFLVSFLFYLCVEVMSC